MRTYGACHAIIQPRFVHCAWVSEAFLSGSRPFFVLKCSYPIGFVAGQATVRNCSLVCMADAKFVGFELVLFLARA